MDLVQVIQTRIKSGIPWVDMIVVAPQEKK
jgi:hypothetical protein